MSGYDFNDAEQQQIFELIPNNTIVPLVMYIRPGGTGPNGILRQSKSSDAEMLDCEFTVESGPYAKRKIFQMFTLSGGKLDEKGESIGGKISRQTLRAILESARGINPDDTSEAARQARRINDWLDFNGMTFLARLGVEKDRTGQYNDKNKIKSVIVPGERDYQRPGAGAQPASQPGWQTQPSESVSPRPSWA